MKPITNASPPLLAWIVVLLLSVGLNVYWLTAVYWPTHAPATPAAATATARLVSSPAAANDEDDDDSNEEDDASWVALSEELRQTRRQLADCQGHSAATATHQIVSQ